MRNFTIYLALLACLFASKVVAQDSFEAKAKVIANKIEKITKDEKELLKIEIEEVNKQFESGAITKAQADENKKELAEARAVIIENKITVVQEELKDLVQDKVNGKINTNEISFTVTDSFTIDIKGMKKSILKKREYKEKRTTSQFVFALGLNNVVTDGNLENSDFRFMGSHFYEWGISYNTRIAKNNNLLHLKYGFSVMYNNLRPTEDRLFVVNGNQTNLEDSGLNLRDSRFRNVYLVAPLHLEFDFSDKKVKDGKTTFRTHQAMRIGLGGYAGVRVKSKQILKYEINDFDYKERQRGDFNVNNFIYGLSAYIGYKETSLYLKYDLNPIFQNNTIKQNNVSLGARFDFN